LGLETETLQKGAEPKELEKNEFITPTPEYFYLSIPKLGIKNALVEANSDNLNPVNSIGHYPGTELPGERGNAFIFGHSVLPWFFNPKNYKTIFSTLPELEINDEIIITINGKELTYTVESKEELPPDKVQPLGEIKPAYLNESTIVLMTCSPPGTKLKRLLVNAVLVK
jgi:sortase A